MKFTDGYWMTKPAYRLDYATEVARWGRCDGGIEAIVLCRAYHGARGALLNGPTLTVRITSPMENVLRVKLTHFQGARDAGPHLRTEDQACEVSVEENDAGLSICSGSLRAEIGKGEWSLSFSGAGKRLTGSGWHCAAHAYDDAQGVTYMMEALELGVGGLVYGLGERFGPYVKNGQVVDMWNSDGGTSSERAYKNVPFYMTNQGYGVLVEDTGDVSFEVCSEKVERVQFSTRSESLTYDVIYGPTPKEILVRYTALTGRPALPPAWSFGLWLSTSFTTDYDEATTSSFIQGMAERGIPLSVFHFDCYWMRGLNWCDFTWDADTFPDPEGMLRRYKERGLHICVWINSYVAQASPLFAEGMAGGYFIRKTDGSVWQTDMWQAGMAIVDVTNPAARAWYCGKLEKLLDMGVDCLKTDFGERIPVRSVRYFDGSDPLKMHNQYAVLYNQMVFELLEKRRGKGEAVLFARSAAAGGQQYPVHWGGDCSASYLSMAETLRAGLSLAHCGFGFWSHDISGFEATAPADVYKRWCQFGLLSSHSRLHGSSSYRVPWLFDEEACDVLRRFTRLKCRLMPYLYALAVEAHETGVPMLRPMVMEFPFDRTAQLCDTQYMLGDSLLVAPMFDANEVEYYLPRGRWMNLLDGHVVQGGGWVKERYDMMSMPLMVREGSVVPVGQVDDRPNYDYAQGVTLHVYGLKEGKTRTVRLVNTRGETEAMYEVRVENGQALVQTDTDRPYNVVMHEM